MPLFAARCPVPERERVWIEKMLAWCRTEFGSGALAGPVVTPTPEFFPAGYQGTAQDVQRIVAVVGVHMEVDPDDLSLEIYPYGVPQIPRVASKGSTVAGHYRRQDGKGVIAIGLEDAGSPRRVVAVAAHELCHHKLLFDDRISSGDADHEPLTDLATVFFGLGVFTANAAFQFSQGRGGWRSQRLGYLTQPMFGYALACYAAMRGETAPGWATHLDTNPRGYMKQGLRYLEGNPLGTSVS